MKKLRNDFLDCALFIAYHLFFLVGTGFFLFVITFDIAFDDFETIKRKLKQTISEPTSLETKVEVKIPLIKKIRGTVLVTEPKMNARPAIEGEELKEGTSIETSDKSSALLVFGDKYTCTMRISGNTKINVDDLLKKDPTSGEEFSYIYVIKGYISLWVKNSNDTARISVKTKHSTFGVRGTQFSVISDGEFYSLLSVKEGSVEAMSFSSLQKKMITTNSNYLITSGQPDKEFSDPDIVKRLDWDFENLEAELPALTDAITSNTQEATTGAEATASVSEQTRNLKAEIDAELQAFKSYSKDLSDYLANDNTYLAEVVKTYEDEKPKIKADIGCLSTSKTQCNLYMENRLIKRGFPRTFGTPKFIQMMIDDLKAYLLEQETDIAKTKTNISSMEALTAKRELLLKEVELQLVNQSELELIIEKLKNPELVHKK